MKITARDLAVWNAAITLANNICVQQSDRFNDDDLVNEARAAADCADRIRGWHTPSSEQLAELLHEAGVRDDPDPLGDALNSGDGIYRP